MQPPDFFLAWNVQLHIFWSPDVSLTSFQRHRPSQQAFHVPLFVSTTIESQLGGDFFWGESKEKPTIFRWCIHFLNLFIWWSAWVLCFGIFLNLPTSTFKREGSSSIPNLFRWWNQFWNVGCIIQDFVVEISLDGPTWFPLNNNTDLHWYYRYIPYNIQIYTNMFNQKTNLYQDVNAKACQSWMRNQITAFDKSTYKQRFDSIDFGSQFNQRVSNPLSQLRRFQGILILA